MKRYLLIAALFVAAAQPAWSTCSNRTLKGTYGLDGSGIIFPPPVPPAPPVVGPFVRVGAVRFDGAGGVEYITVSSYNGIVTDEPYVGTYTVEADCRFTYSAFLPPPIGLPVTFSGFAAATGDRVDYMLVEPHGAAVQATLLRQPQRNCQTRDLFGTFTMTSSGVMLPPHPNAGSFLRVGTMTATPDARPFGRRGRSAGTFTINATANYNGLNVSETFGGTYEVQPDCTVHFDYVPAGGNLDTSFDGVLVDGDNQVIFMISTSSFVVSGTMTRSSSGRNFHHAVDAAE
jgi:hypothetical protein